MENSELLIPTKENILNLTDAGRLIFMHFMPDLRMNGKKFKSTKCPFYEDKKASFSIYRLGDRYRFNDFGDRSINGDCFDFALKWYSEILKKPMYFNDMLIQLFKDLGLDGKTKTDLIIASNNGLNLPLIDERQTKNRKFDLFTRDFDLKDLNFWSQFGVDEQTLNRLNVKALNYYQTFDENLGAFKEFNCKVLTYAFVGLNYAKIYQPSPKRFFWIGNKPKDYIFGIENLPDYSNGEFVFITGGEKDVLTLSSLGYYAVCLNSETSDVPEKLKHIFYESCLTPKILYDIDDTGLKRGDEISKQLYCENIILPLKLKDKGGKDISDWIKLGLNIDELKSILGRSIKDECIINETKEISENFEQLTEVDDSKEIFTGKELIDLNIDEIPTLVTPIFPKVGLVALGGSSDTGKSSLLRQFATSVCLGDRDFLGFDLNSEHKSCIYVSTEDDENAMAFLLKKQMLHRRNESKDYQGLRYIFNSENILSKLNQELKRQPADVVIIDAYSDIFQGEVNQVNRVRSFLEEYSNLAKKHRCLIIFLHHTAKNAENKEPSKNNLLGSQGFEAKMRMVMLLRTDLEEPSIKHLCIVKGNYLTTEYKTESFELYFNEHMTFENTGIRIPFEELVKTSNKDEDDEQDKKVIELRSKGLTITEIAEKTNLSRSKVGRLVKGQ